MRTLTNRQWGALLVAGNHLASSLVQNDHLPNDFKTYAEAFESQGLPYADMWIGWRIIMDIRDSTSD
jgi:hypothetical protein